MTIETFASLDRWDRYFMSLCVLNALMSKDPSTQVGAVLVGQNREVIATGFNGFPRGIEDSEERLAEREMKYKLVVHAEMNAVLSAARNGIRTEGTTLYLVAMNKTGAIWGGCPCTRCSVELIQAGISKIVTLKPKAVPSHWSEDVAFANTLMDEAGIEVEELDL